MGEHAEVCNADRVRTLLTVSRPQILTSAEQAPTTVPRSAPTLSAPTLAAAALDTDPLIVEGLAKVKIHYIILQN